MNANARRRLEDLERALARLEDALAVPEEAPLAIDGTIQRFEFVFELCWKTMKALLDEASPAEQFGTARAAIKGAYAAGGFRMKPDGSICSRCATPHRTPIARRSRATSTGGSRRGRRC